jgi:hypothetical protein
MHLIYRHAYVTIIVTAGHDPTYGLPGVGRRLRSPQSQVNLQHNLLVSTLPDSRELIRAST